MRLQRGNPMARAMMIMLFLEMVAFALAIPVLIQLAGVRASLALLSAGGVALFCLACGGLLRTSAGFWLGWLAQLTGLALGLLHPVMFFVGGIFTFLYGLAFVLGKKIEHAQQRGHRARAG